MKRQGNKKDYLIIAAAVLLPGVYYIKKFLNGGLPKFTEEGMSVFLPLLAGGVLIFVFLFRKKMEEKERKKRRREEMKKSYPEFAMKLSMLIQAGFSPRSAFEKVGRNYRKRRERDGIPKNVLYEELITSIREMESGVPETESYERFERRCEIFELTRLSGLLIRAVKRGGSSLGEELQEESIRASNAQKELVRKKGETAGTRLLFPMTVYLIIVMIMILYPAFSTLSSL